MAVAGQSPATPTVTEPELDGQQVSPADVHMESSSFSDPDPGDAHRCSDWEIWSADLSERVWAAPCIGGVERTHTHLGDGAFEGSHADVGALSNSTDYVLRVRHRDDSNDPAVEWSDWGPRSFQTLLASSVVPLELRDVRDAPAPEWRDGNGAGVLLSGGSPGPSLRLDDVVGNLLLELRGVGGAANQIVNPPTLNEHVDVRLTLDGGSAGVSLPATDLRVFDEHGEVHTILVPALTLDQGASRSFWIASNGGSYDAEASDPGPSFGELARGPSLPWVALEPGFVIDVVAEGLQLPVNIAFVRDPGDAPDDPAFYVSELYGSIVAVTRDGSIGTFASGLLDFAPTGLFPGSGEQGLTGLAIDPLSGDLFAAMLYDSPGSPGTHYPKVDRFTSVDGGRTAATRTTVLDMAGESQGQSHQISNLSFGPDGMLYVHMGDGFSAATAQNPSSFRGKILRLHADGSAPSDNPFYDAADGVDARDYTFALGVRNPFGGAWRETDGLLYEVENGPSIDRLGQVVGGRNFLWDGSNASMTQLALHTWSPAVGPVNIAFIQPGSSCGSGFLVGMYDRAFVTESGPTWATGPQSRGKRITRFELAADGSVLDGPTTIVRYEGSGKATAVALAAGPDGLYFSELYRDLDYVSPPDRGARILRLRSLGGPPVSLIHSGSQFGWGAVAEAIAYDVTRGGLALLRASGGDFAASAATCLANDHPLTAIADANLPPAGDGYWYLVRDVHVDRVGCFESSGPAQVGGRDAELAVAAGACP